MACYRRTEPDFWNRYENFMAKNSYTAGDFVVVLQNTLAEEDKSGFEKVLLRVYQEEELETEEEGEEDSFQDLQDLQEVVDSLHPQDQEALIRELGSFHYLD